MYKVKFYHECSGQNYSQDELERRLIFLVNDEVNEWNKHVEEKSIRIINTLLANKIFDFPVIPEVGMKLYMLGFIDKLEKNSINNFLYKSGIQTEEFEKIKNSFYEVPIPIKEVIYANGYVIGLLGSDQTYYMDNLIEKISDENF